MADLFADAFAEFDTTTEAEPTSIFDDAFNEFTDEPTPPEQKTSALQDHLFGPPERPGQYVPGEHMLPVFRGAAAGVAGLPQVAGGQASSVAQAWDEIVKEDNFQKEVDRRSEMTVEEMIKEMGTLKFWAPSSYAKDAGIFAKTLNKNIKPSPEGENPLENWGEKVIQDNVDYLKTQHLLDDNDKWTYKFGHGTSSFAAGIGLTMINPMLTLAAFGADAQSRTFREAMDAGVPFDEAFDKSIGHGILEGGLETAGSLFFLKYFGGNLLVAMGLHGLAEGTEELLQTGADNSLNYEWRYGKYAPEYMKKPFGIDTMFEGGKDAFTIGALLGFLGSGGSYRIQQQRIEKYLRNEVGYSKKKAHELSSQVAKDAMLGVTMNLEEVILNDLKKMGEDVKNSEHVSEGRDKLEKYMNERFEGEMFPLEDNLSGTIEISGEMDEETGDIAINTKEIPKEEIATEGRDEAIGVIKEVFDDFKNVVKGTNVDDPSQYSEVDTWNATYRDGMVGLVNKLKKEGMSDEGIKRILYSKFYGNFKRLFKTDSFVAFVERFHPDKIDSEDKLIWVPELFKQVTMAEYAGFIRAINAQRAQYEEMIKIQNQEREKRGEAPLDIKVKYITPNDIKFVSQRTGGQGSVVGHVRRGFDHAYEKSSIGKTESAFDLGKVMRAETVSGLIENKGDDLYGAEPTRPTKTLGPSDSAPVAEGPVETQEKETPEDIIKKEREEFETEDELNIWHGTGENADLSNLSARPFDWDEKHYETVEHAYQTLKSGMFDKKTFEKAWADGKKYRSMRKAKTANDWNVDLMEGLIEESFRQNPEAKAKLLATGDAKLTHNQDKGVWNKKFPEILEKVRKKFRDEIIKIEGEGSGPPPEVRVTEPTAEKPPDSYEVTLTDTQDPNGREYKWDVFKQGHGAVLQEDENSWLVEYDDAYGQPSMTRIPKSTEAAQVHEFTPDDLALIPQTENDILVFGSNNEGRHGKGVAKVAVTDFDAHLGTARGPQGRSYGVVTKADWRRQKSSSLKEIKEEVDGLMEYAKQMPEQTFWVSRIGTGLAGWTKEDIAPMFTGYPSNMKLPQDWVPLAQAKAEDTDVAVVPEVEEKPDLEKMTNDVANDFDNPKGTYSEEHHPILNMRSDIEDFEYTGHQYNALVSIGSFIDHPVTDDPKTHVAVINGAAGTGKTTIVENIVKYAKGDFQLTSETKYGDWKGKTHSVNVTAPTNAAVKVLKRKLSHFLGDEDAKTIYTALYGQPEEREGKLHFEYTEKELPNILIVDEASMVSEKMLSDIMKAVKENHSKVIFLGDGVQLPPVDGVDPKLLTNENPMKPTWNELRQVKRQALGSYLLQFVTAIRNLPPKNMHAKGSYKYLFPKVNAPDGSVVVNTPNQAKENFVKDVVNNKDVIYLTGTNARRVSLNHAARKGKWGDHKAPPQKGDVAIVIRNGTHWKNGELLTFGDVDIVSTQTMAIMPSIYKKKIKNLDVKFITVDTENGKQKFMLIPDFDEATLGNEFKQIIDHEKLPTEWTTTKKTYHGPRKKLNNDVQIATYGFAVTGHKSQGSQWKKVYVDDSIGHSFATNEVAYRWSYTVATRPSDKIVVAASNAQMRGVDWDMITDSAMESAETFDKAPDKNKTTPQQEIEQIAEEVDKETQEEAKAIADLATKQSEATPDVAPTVVARRDHPMYYKMPGAQNLTGQDTTTIDLAEQGLRTSTTRSYALGEKEDIITFEGKPQEYRVTGSHVITKEDLANDEFVENLSKSEQWTVDAIKGRHRNQIKPGAVVTYYERINVATEDPNTEVVDLTPQSKMKTDPDYEWVNHSGGANGSDTFWARIGRKFGVKTKAYTFEGRTGSDPADDVLLTPEQLAEGRKHAEIANKTLGRSSVDRMAPFIRNLISRNWFQIKDSQEIFAVGNTGRDGNVLGGTAWAVQMAVDNKKTVHFYNQTQGQWYKNTDGTWQKEETPVLTKKFAGIGTRNINASGEAGIQDVFDKTFKGVPRETPPVTKKERHQAEANEAVKNTKTQVKSHKSVDNSLNDRLLKLVTEYLESNPLPSNDVEQAAMRDWISEKAGVSEDVIKDTLYRQDSLVDQVKHGLIDADAMKSLVGLGRSRQIQLLAALELLSEMYGSITGGSFKYRLDKTERSHGRVEDVEEGDIESELRELGDEIVFVEGKTVKDPDITGQDFRQAFIGVFKEGSKPLQGDKDEKPTTYVRSEDERLLDLIESLKPQRKGEDNILTPEDIKKKKDELKALDKKSKADFFKRMKTDEIKYTMPLPNGTLLTVTVKGKRIMNIDNAEYKWGIGKDWQYFKKEVGGKKYTMLKDQEGMDPETANVYNETPTAQQLKDKIKAIENILRIINEKRGIVIDTYLAELQTKMIDMDPMVVAYINDKIKNIKNTSDPQEIQGVNSTIRQEQQEKSKEAETLEEARDMSYITFEVNANFQLETKEGTVTLPPGEYKTFTVNDASLVLETPQGDFTLTSQQFMQIYNTPLVNWDRNTIHYLFAGFNLDPSIWDDINYREDSSMVPMHTLFSYMKKMPWVMDVMGMFAPVTSKKLKTKVKNTKTFNRPSDAVKRSLMDFKTYKDGILKFIAHNLFPIQEEYTRRMNKRFDAGGIVNINGEQYDLADKKATTPEGVKVREEIERMVMAMMASVAAGVHVDNQTESMNFSFTRNMDGLHQPTTQKGRDPDWDQLAYVEFLALIHNTFGIPFTGDTKVDINDVFNTGKYDQQQPNKDTDTYRWSTRRDNTMWNLMAHENIMPPDMAGDLSALQKIILLIKKNIENPTLKTALEYNIWQSTDIFQSMLNGYTHRVWDIHPDQQSTTGARGGEKATGSKLMHAREYPTFEGFRAAGLAGEWVVVDDFFTSALDYFVDTSIAIKQAQIVSFFKEQRIGGLDYSGPTPDEWYGRKDWDNYTPQGEFNVVMYPDSDAIVNEAKRLSEEFGQRVTPEAVLTKLGYAQGKTSPGLAQWKYGAFEPPWIYKAVDDLIYETQQALPTLQEANSIISGLRLLRHIKTINPVDNIGPWIMSSLVTRPWLMPYNIAKTFVQTAAYIPYGLVVTGPQMLKGEYRGLDYGNEEKYPLLPIFSKLGLSGIGWNYALHQMLDTEQQAAHKPGKSISFPNLKTAGQKWGDYGLSLGGISTAIFDHMIADQIYLGASTLYNKYRKKGYGHEDAARIAVQVINHGSFMLHRSVFHNEGLWEDILLMSRQFFTTSLRTAVFLGEQSPVGLAVGSGVGFGLGGPAGAALGGVAGWMLAPKLRQFASTYKTGPKSKMLNSIFGGELTNLDHKVMSKEISFMVLSLGFWGTVLNGALQYVLSFDDDDEKDEHGEVGSELGNKAKKRWMVFNQDPLSARLPAKDYDQRQLFLRPMFSKMYNDQIDIYGGAIEAAYNYGREPEDRIEIGKGIAEWTKNKSGMIKFFQEEIDNADSYTHEAIYNREKSRFEGENLEMMFKRYAFELLGPIGTEEMVGSPDMPPEVMHGLEVSGFNIRRGSPYAKGSTAREYSDTASKAATQKFKDKKRRGQQRFMSPEEIKEGRKGTGPDRESMKRLQKKRRNPLRALKKGNKKVLREYEKDKEKRQRSNQKEGKGALIEFFSR